MKKTLVSLVLGGALMAGCSANTNVLCAFAPYLPFNISACATPSAAPSPAAAK